MKPLNVQVAHGWWSQGKPGASIQVNCYAIGSPKFSQLVVSVAPELSSRTQGNTRQEYLHLFVHPSATIKDYATHWSAQSTWRELLDGQTGGGEMLSDEAVMVLASQHPEWFMGRDLCHILAVLEERYDKPTGEILVAREDLRIFVEVISSPSWEEEVAYAA